MQNNIKQQPYSILFIEDEDETRNNYVKYLKRYFMTVYEARDGEQALKIYRDKKPDILIIDINLPKISGIELLEIIRKKDHTTKALMLTAHSSTNFLLKATELKLTKYLIKPISRNELKDALDLVIKELNSFNTVSKNTFIFKEDYIWDYTEQKLSKNHVEIVLTLQERQVLELLLNHININISYDNIILHLWDDFETDKLNSVKTIIKTLRKKLPDDTILNIFGFGYKINSI